MKARLKALLFALLGKDPEAVVLSVLSGDHAKSREMLKEAVRILSRQRHFAAGFQQNPNLPGVTWIALRRGGFFSLYWQLRRAMRPWRIGMLPLLFDGSREHRALRLAAFALAPLKILAYNASVERHHLHPRAPVASLLFWRGVALDRIHLRPWWMRWATHERTEMPADAQWFRGREPRRNRRRVGVLSPFVPFPLAHGGAVRLFSLLREMSLEYDLFLFAFRETETPREVEPLLEFCSGVGLVTKPRYREPRWSSLLPPEVCEYESGPMRRLLEVKRAHHRIEVVQIEYTHLARYDGEVLVEHDVTFDLQRQVLDRKRSIGAVWNYYRWHRFERAAVKRFARIVVMSEKDARLLGAPHTTVIPNGVDLERFQPRPCTTDGASLLFIGAFRHFPNAEAYRFLIKEVWPLVQEKLPDATLTVIAGPSPHLYWQSVMGEREIPTPGGVTLRAFVSDVRPSYSAANIVLIPTLVSAGTNIKVLEAMAMERAIVSTTSGCGGIPVAHGKHVWIANGAREFAEAICKLDSDAELRAKLASSARALVESQFSWATLGEMQRRLIADLLPERLRLRSGSMLDLDRVFDIQRVTLPSSRWDPVAYLEHEFYIAEHDGEVVGFLVARRTAPSEREVLNIGVDPAAQGQGIGAALLLKLIRSGASGDVFLEVRESNQRARSLYERVGFHIAGRRDNYYDDPPETALVMRIHVPS